ncbi:EpsG family protein [Vibrio cholerae]|uniref:EpsG family protein n=1 Tax=Vibrio cholerae TaxID=666 RepID=UPI0011D9059A|nr:EpsG family protein [Vibrio cholerae]TXX70749.1 EpsG family protein [Vibrio cholerae]BCN17613.1 putative O-antigen polymerase [Vibrio cholerae]GIA60108.1 hypothetical protein VCSRO132_2875 [Vibrio cholerae]
MLPYIGVLVLLTNATIYDKTKYQSIVFFCLALCLILFSGLRVGGTGPADYDAYLRLYSQVTDWNLVVDPQIHAEFGFRLLSFLGNFLDFDGQFIIFAMAALSSIPIFIIILRYSCYPILSLVIWMPYFLAMNMHSSRISVAAAFCLCFVISFYEKKRLASMVFFFVALAFHSSSIAILAVLMTKFKLKSLCVIGFLFFALSSFIDPFSFLSNAFSFLGASRISWFIDSYVGSSDYGYPMKIYDPRILLNLGILCLIYNIIRSVNNYFHIYIFKISVLGIIFLLLFSSATIIAWRVSYLFLLAGVISIPILFQYYNFRVFYIYGFKRVFSISFGLVFFVYSLTLVLKSLPYSFYF